MLPFPYSSVASKSCFSDAFRMVRENVGYMVFSSELYLELLYSAHIHMAVLCHT